MSILELIARVIGWFEPVRDDGPGHPTAEMVRVRATMVLEDVRRSEPSNEKDTKVIGDYTGGLPGVVVVRSDPDQPARQILLDALLGWAPAWDAVFGPFKP